MNNLSENMNEKVKSLVEKSKKAGKPLIVGKSVGGLVGLVTASLVLGQEAILFTSYVGQKAGGYVGMAYYYLTDKRKKDSNS